MKNKKFSRKHSCRSETKILNLFLIFSAFFTLVAYGDEIPKGVVNVAKKTANNRTTYFYRVINNTRFPISKVIIGRNYYTGGDPSLKSLPPGWSLDTPAAGIASPPSWSGKILTQEESTTVYLEWEVSNPLKAIQPGQSLSGFNVTLAAPDDSYSTSSFQLLLVGSTPVSAPLRAGAVMFPPPSLSLQLSPTKLWPPNNKMIEIVATVSSTSESGQAPAIKLESIICGDSCNAAKDMADAHIGTDDRRFHLRSTRTGQGVAGRTYTVIYSATDSLGQSTQKTATVIVPHDNSGK